MLDVFFRDARKALVGERPDRRVADAERPAAAAFGDETATNRIAWSSLIDGDALAAQVKRLTNDLREPMSSPAEFKSGGYQQCQANFSLLATLFAVISEYDGDVRWKSDAAGLRDAMARTAEECASGTEQAKAVASQRKSELDELVRGQPLGVKGHAAVEDWSELADRSVLMQQMETSWDERVSPALAQPREFARRAVDIQQDAQLLAMLAQVIQREAFDNWDDPPFQSHAGELRSAAVDLARAAAERNHAAAAAAAVRIEQSCARCHADYRG